MKTVKLKAYPRTLEGRLGSKKVRSRGRVPAVIYGKGVPTRTIEVVLKEWIAALKEAGAENFMVELTIEGEEAKPCLAFVREAQHHPLSGQLLHLDFHEVDPNEKVTITVPVETVGEAAGVKSGGVLEQVLHKLRVRALPKDLPEVIRIDVSNLNVGQVIHLGDIVPPSGVEILGDKTLPVVAVTMPEVEETTAVPTAAPAPGEVEMIKEKKPVAAKEEAEKGAKKEQQPKAEESEEKAKKK